MLAGFVDIPVLLMVAGHDVSNWTLAGLKGEQVWLKKSDI